MLLFRLLLGIDALVAGVFAWFFLVGLDDGSVSESNIALWLAILAGLAGVLVGGVLLHYRNRDRAAKLLLGLLAVPVVLVAGFFAVLIVTNPSWT